MFALKQIQIKQSPTLHLSIRSPIQPAHIESEMIYDQNYSYLIIAPLHDKCVGLAPDDVYFRDEEPIDVPGDAPANVVCDGGVTVVPSCHEDLLTVTIVLD